MYRQKGFLLIVAAVLIVVIGFLGVAASYLFVSTSTTNTNYLQSSQALFLAESGLEQGIHTLLAYTLTQREGCSGLSLTNTLGKGAYTVTATGPFSPSTPTTLNGALSAAATTIPVVSTANYQSAGRIIIDGESINYSSTNSTNFLGVTRGVDGTTAAAHLTATPIAQYQCTLSSQGGVPSLTAPTNPGSPSGLRTIQESVQLQDGWAVGDNSGSNLTFVRWNKGTEMTWNYAPVSGGSFEVRSVSMVSPVDGWAIGGSATFLRWNGSTWTGVASGLAGSNYQSIFCSARNDCHVVGASRRIGHWNGSSWAQITATGSVAATTLNTVNCGSSTDCWAMGSNAGGGKFYHGTGAPMAWVGIDASALTLFASSGFANSVFCTSASDCWVVGKSNVFARYNGSTWANYSTGLPAVNYNDVICNSASDCWAVGDISGGRDVIAHWDGSAWSRDASNPTPTANLNGVSCAQPNDCWATGVTSSGTNPVFVHWDGTSWTQFTTSGIPGVIMYSIYMFSPSTKPFSAWSETFA